MSQFGEFARNGVAFEVNGDDIKIENSKDVLNAETEENTFRAGGESFTYTFPAHSYTMLKLKLDK